MLAAGVAAAIALETETRRADPAVHAGLFESAGQTYGIGMPIIMRFTIRSPTPVRSRMRVRSR